MGSLSIGCWKIDANRNFLLIWFCLFFFQIDRSVFAYFSPCFSRRIGARVLFYFMTANLPGTGTHLHHKYSSCYSYTTQVLAFTSTYVSIFHKKIEISLYKKTHCASPVTSDIVFHYTVFDAMDILHTLVVSFTANQI